mmetsp:Transcript_84940/g.274574  ORF Transcript_84940/g.274574 Transcript_84940/m.274574 type:complete len:285 (-) Transcript_84940:409-1263(-)
MGRQWSRWWRRRQWSGWWRRRLQTWGRDLHQSRRPQSWDNSRRPPLDVRRPGHHHDDGRLHPGSQVVRLPPLRRVWRCRAGPEENGRHAGWRLCRHGRNRRERETLLRGDGLQRSWPGRQGRVWCHRLRPRGRGRGRLRLRRRRWEADAGRQGAPLPGPGAWRLQWHPLWRRLWRRKAWGRGLGQGRRPGPRHLCRGPEGGVRQAGSGHDDGRLCPSKEKLWLPPLRPPQRRTPGLAALRRPAGQWCGNHLRARRGRQALISGHGLWGWRGSQLRPQRCADVWQ